MTRPAVKFTADNDPLHVQDYGEIACRRATGIIAADAPKLSAARYGTLVAQVDADGNDLGGIRDVFVEVPIGTYTGWNYFNKDFFEDGSAPGSFIPFVLTKAGPAHTDWRPSLEERYPTKEVYVADSTAVSSLVALPIPAARRCHPAGIPRPTPDDW